MDHKIVVLVLAFVGSVLATCGTVDHCDTCVYGPCTICIANYYLDAGVCLGCSASNCGGSQWYDSTACTGTNSGCKACGGPCPTGQYFRSSLCLGPNNGCEGCTDCVIGTENAFGKAYGDVCGGPSPFDHNAPECLTPGQALCEACFDWVPEFQNNGLPEEGGYQEFCDGERPNDWWYLGNPAKDEDDLEACCGVAKTAFDNGDCDFDVARPLTTQRSCAYNIVFNCMDIAATWPNPQAYPVEPQPQCTDPPC